ncbi:hypothetical protein AJ80_03912 [Polytolypa hystricis UAMH7299]|uniref:Amidohydrolase-related domain-containing protein n=1 Tax=Polytolypa hystricis (strain UAMH7299) TaxID=1447883 RepID=A0A2B7YEV7_POLH7|nr:hypothetical protein AJ80_03912 [Polytolypa hystricis UAMH7299]
MAELPSTTGSPMPSFPKVDIHTHVYPESYMTLLRSRSTVPYIYDPPSNAPSRLIILSSDDNPSIPKENRGRPVDSSYYDVNEKLSFMRTHNITTSVISLANPWLDFLSPDEAAFWATKINDDLNALCESQAPHSGTLLNESSLLFAFGALPLSAPSTDIIANEINRMSSLKYIRGAIMGTSGLGKGLDDPGLDPVWAALESTQTLLFLHPHYGLPNDAFGGKETIERYGHVLPLALGFPLETTIAVTRMYLSRVFDRFPRLQILLAHSGGTLPFLAGRIESCIAHERKFVVNGGDVEGPGKSIWDVLKQNILLDAVVYSEVGLKAAVHGAGSVDRVLFGTDHPFFPPLNSKEETWLSVTMNQNAINSAFGEDSESAKAILGGNAARILKLDA